MAETSIQPVIPSIFQAFQPSYGMKSTTKDLTLLHSKAKRASCIDAGGPGVIWRLRHFVLQLHVKVLSSLTGIKIVSEFMPRNCDCIVESQFKI